MQMNRIYREDNPNGDPNGPTRADNHAAYVDSLGPAIIAKVSRLAQLRRTASAESDALREERQTLLQGLMLAKQQIEGLRNSQQRGAADEIAILETRLGVMNSRMATLEAQSKGPHQRAAAARAVLERTLKEIEQRYGGGNNAHDLFDAMNWR